MSNNIEKNYIYKNDTIHIYIDEIKKILYVDVVDGNYNKKNFEDAIEYYKNFWILMNNSNILYNQIFIFNNCKIYPLEFYDTVFKTLKSLETIFKENLIESYLINNSNAIDILKPILNLYKAVKPFYFIKNISEVKILNDKKTMLI